MYYILVHLITFGLLISACDTHRPSLDIPKLMVPTDELTHDIRGVYYYKDSIFSGFALDSYDGKILKSIASYYNGKLEGESVGFYLNGDTSYVRPYHMGEKHGYHFGYYPDGQKKFKYYFENGFSQGNHKYWFFDGRLKQDLNYVDGKELGAQKVWRPDGKLRSNYVVRENGRKYGMLGLKRCAKIDSETKTVDPYTGQSIQSKNAN